jgi:hypothetical protein
MQKVISVTANAVTAPKIYNPYDGFSDLSKVLATKKIADDKLKLEKQRLEEEQKRYDTRLARQNRLDQKAEDKEALNYAANRAILAGDDQLHVNASMEERLKNRLDTMGSKMDTSAQEKLDDERKAFINKYGISTTNNKTGNKSKYIDQYKLDEEQRKQWLGFAKRQDELNKESGTAALSDRLNKNLKLDRNDPSQHLLIMEQELKSNPELAKSEVFTKTLAGARKSKLAAKQQMEKAISDLEVKLLGMDSFKGVTGTSPTLKYKDTFINSMMDQNSNSLTPAATKELQTRLKSLMANHGGSGEQLKKFTKQFVKKFGDKKEFDEDVKEDINSLINNSNITFNSNDVAHWKSKDPSSAPVGMSAKDIKKYNENVFKMKAAQHKIDELSRKLDSFNTDKFIQDRYNNVFESSAVPKGSTTTKGSTVPFNMSKKATKLLEKKVNQINFPPGLSSDEIKKVKTVLLDRGIMGHSTDITQDEIDVILGTNSNTQSVRRVLNNILDSEPKSRFDKLAKMNQDELTQLYNGATKAQKNEIQSIVNTHVYDKPDLFEFIPKSSAAKAEREREQALRKLINRLNGEQ